MKKNKGFTMVELLVVIVIIGLLATIGMISFRAIQDNASDEYYDTTQENIILAAKSYYEANNKLLPSIEGDEKQITLETLINNNYLEDIYDKNQEKCNYKESKVTVSRLKEADYKYDVFLVCNDPNFKDDDTSSESTNFESDIIFTSNNQEVAEHGTVFDDLTITGTSKSLTSSKIVSATMKVYQKIDDIYKPTNYNFHPDQLNEEQIEIIGLIDYTMQYAELKVELTVVDNKGKVETYSEFITISPPRPEIPTYTAKVGSSTGTTYVSSDSWSNSAVWVGNLNSTGTFPIEKYEWKSSCTGNTGVITDSYLFDATHVGSNELDDCTYEFRAIDEKGTASEWGSPLTLKLDFKAPTIPTSTLKYVSSTGTERDKNARDYTNQTLWWGNFNATATGAPVLRYEWYEYYSGNSGNLSTSHTYTSTRNTIFKIRSVDEAGNVSDWSSWVYIRVDKTAPTCTNSGFPSSYQYWKKTITGTCSDSHSGCKSSTVTKTITTSTSSVTPGAVYDNAGNSKICGYGSVYLAKKYSTVRGSVLRNYASCGSGGNAYQYYTYTSTGSYTARTYPTWSFNPPKIGQNDAGGYYTIRDSHFSDATVTTQLRAAYGHNYCTVN